LTPGKRVKAGQGDEEARFSVGDGVLVKVEGGVDGVGVLVRLWEEPDDEVEEDDEEDKDGQDDDDAKGGDADGRANGEGSRSGPGNDINGNGTTRTRSKTRMMAEIHWCFRRKDLPGIMKNLSVEDVRDDLDHRSES
jgi:origin recognition complex subunit 1